MRSVDRTLGFLVFLKSERLAIPEQIRSQCYSSSMVPEPEDMFQELEKVSGSQNMVRRGMMGQKR